jgi:hypothetical protein
MATRVSVDISGFTKNHNFAVNLIGVNKIAPNIIALVASYIYIHIYDIQHFQDLIRRLNVNVMFCFPALSLAMSRDGSSGGVVRLADISKDGVEKFTILGDQLPRFDEG